MYNHLAAYVASLAAVTDSDVTANQDDVLQRRNNHLIMSEQFNLIGSFGLGTTLTRARFGNVALTQRAQQHLWPTGRLATVDSRPYVNDLRDTPIKLPVNEELTILATTDAAGPAQVAMMLFLQKPQATYNLPPYKDRLTVRCTAVVAAATETTWTALAPVVQERDLFNGVYCVIGANLIAANALAFRLFFPSQPSIEGRQLRPGGLVQNALGDFAWPVQRGGLGEWGRFHTFEQPSVQVAGDAAGGTYEIRLDLLYLGESMDLLKRF